MRNVLAPEPHPGPASRLNSATWMKSFFAQSLEVVTESEQPIQLYSKVRWEWTEWQWIAIVVNTKLTFGPSIVKMKGHRHRFCIAEL